MLVVDRGEHNAATTFVTSPVAGVVDENPPHQRRRHREKVAPIAPLHPIDICQPEIRLVHERRCLERVVSALILHVVMREAPQLPIDDRHERIARGWIVVRPCRQQRRHVLNARAIFGFRHHRANEWGAHLSAKRHVRKDIRP